MTNPNERIHEAFREYLRTTDLRRDGNSGTIVTAGRLSGEKRRDLLAALDVTIGYYRDGRLSSPDPEYLGRVFWNALVTSMDNGTTEGDWNRAREYPTNRRACVQIGEWLLAHRELADGPTEATQNAAPALMVGDPVWIRSMSTLGEYRGMSGTLATAIYRRDGETYLTAQVTPDDLMPMRGVAMTLIPDGPRSSYSLDYTLQSNPQEVTFLRWYSEAQGLARDQALYVTLANGISSEFIPAWRLQPAVAPAPVAPDRDIRAGADPGWVFHRTTGRIVWAQGFSGNGLAFDPYPNREGAFGQRLGTNAARSEEYAWLRPGDPLLARERNSYGLRLDNRTWTVENLDHVASASDGLRVQGLDAAGGVRHGYAAASAFTVDVAAALRKVAEPPLLPVNEHVVTIGGVEYVRKATVDADMETLTRTLHAAADSNGLCGVYDRTVVQVDEATTLLKMGAARGRYRAVITETYTIVREIDVPNEHRSDDHARSAAEVTAALRIADIPWASGLIRSAVTVDRVTRQS